MPRAAPLSVSPDVPRVGARIRALRRERGLTIEQVAAATGLTKGFISQLERDRSQPSLSSIARICDALGVRLSHVFERDPAPALVRRDERPEIDTYFPTSNYLLSGRDEQRFQAIESVVAPGAGAGDDLYTPQALTNGASLRLPSCRGGGTQSRRASAGGDPRPAPRRPRAHNSWPVYLS